MPRPRWSKAASRGLVEEAIAAVMPRAGAMEAVATGVLVAAAEEPSVLLGPLQILVGGGGAGLRAVDGRTLQPGRGVPRPRGFVSTDEIPPAARVAVPTLPAALATALASVGGASLARAVGPAVEVARPRSEARAKLLERFARRGAAALVESRVAVELVVAAGRLAGGLLTREDLEQLRPATAACAVEDDVARVPWGGEAVRDPSADGVDASHVELVAAMDARGLVVIACYEVAEEGVEVPALGLLAPARAVPVRRGEPRTRPGARLSAAAPIALVWSAGVVVGAVGVAGRRDAEREAGEAARAVARGETPDVARCLVVR